jgi:hypothetical protein
LKTELAAGDKERLQDFMKTLPEESGDVSVDGTSTM